MEYNRHPTERFTPSSVEDVPDMVKQFVVYFYRHIRERNIREIYTMYEVSFAKLTERFYKGALWPAVELIADLVDNDHVFCLLYKEMYFRHLYATTQPTLEQRCASWDNYCELFGVILHGNVNMQLPNGWLWDMVDEFIYQFQAFCQYRGKLASRTPAELAALRKMDGVWAVLSVLNYLQALADKSKVAAELAAEGGMERFAETEGYDSAVSNVLRMLGFFSLIGLNRVHTLIGDYAGALRALHPINPFQARHLVTPKIAGAHITLYYYAGFCYMMSRRWLDAARAFNIVLGYIARVKQYHQRSALFEQLLKKNEQMYALLAITCSLCPAATRVLDETIATALMEKNADKMHKLLRGSEAQHEELFSYACPKFVTAAPPNLDAPQVNTNQEAYRLQLRLFLGLVAQQRHLPTLKQFLNLYTSISLAKLSSLMDMDEPALQAQLMLLKQSSYCPTYPGSGPCTAATLQPCGDLDFFVDSDPATGGQMINVADVKPAKRQGEFLARHILRFEEIIRDLNAMPATPSAGPAPARGAAQAAC